MSMGIAFGSSFKCLGGVVSPSFLGVSHILAESTPTLPFSDDFRREYLASFNAPIELGASNEDVIFELMVPDVDFLLGQFFRSS